LNASHCYDILGLQKDASFKDIKQAYRRLSLRYHPDRNKDRNADRKFKEITEAYQILKTEQKKENAKHKDVEVAQTEFWRYYDKNANEEFRSSYQAHYNEFRRNFGANEDSRSHNVEKAVSHKMTHLLLYGGLGAIALWIIISEILK
jgi:molecular chaperone DnaJ